MEERKMGGDASAGVGDKLSLSTVIKMSSAKSKALISKKELPRAQHMRFRTRKSWRISQPRLEKRLLVKATLDKALHTLSQHQTSLLNGIVDAAPTFDEVLVGDWKLVSDGGRTHFEEEKVEPATTDEPSAHPATTARPLKRHRDEENYTNVKKIKLDLDHNNNDHQSEEAATLDENEDEIIDVESDGSANHRVVLPSGIPPLPPLPPLSPPVSPPYYFPAPVSPPLPLPFIGANPTPNPFDYYFYCVRFFYHYNRITAGANSPTGLPSTGTDFGETFGA